MPTHGLIDHAEPIPPAAYWELLMNLTKREVKGRYSQSFFGVGWAIAQPLATMAVFTLVFSRLANIDVRRRAVPAVRVCRPRALVLLPELRVSGTMSLITTATSSRRPISRARSFRSRKCARGFIDFCAAAGAVRGADGRPTASASLSGA